MADIRDIIEQRTKERPADVARTYALLERSDALNSALRAVEDEEGMRPEAKVRDLEALQVMLEEVNRDFARARRELGIPG